MAQATEAFKSLEREYVDIDKQIKNLQKRKAKIEEIFESIAELTGKLVSKPRVRSHPTKGTTQKGSAADKVMAILSHGDPMHIREIAKALFEVNHPTSEQRDRAATVCSALYKKNRVVRVSGGTYRSRFPTPNAGTQTPVPIVSTGYDPENPSNLRSIEEKSVAHIGSDTRVVQMRPMANA